MRQQNRNGKATTMSLEVAWRILDGKSKEKRGGQSFQELKETPIDGSPQGSAIPGILQARTLEWVAIAFS